MSMADSFKSRSPKSRQIRSRSFKNRFSDFLNIRSESFALASAADQPSRMMTAVPVSLVEEPPLRFGIPQMVRTMLYILSTRVCVWVWFSSAVRYSISALNCGSMSLNLIAPSSRSSR